VQGDSTARGSGRERQKGQTQAEQSAILAAFRKGSINVIVATCIGEEGLDVPQVSARHDAPTMRRAILRFCADIIHLCVCRGHAG
jgi:excinuclease UvrABC helicase subunit UvrB